MTMQRFGTCVRLRPEKRSDYLELHRAVWPEVEATLRSANIRNYTIFDSGELLFAYYEYVVDDHERDQARIAADPVTQRWWRLTDPCQKRLPGTPAGNQWLPLTEVWHLAEAGDD
jgi:L-rhamnose mutarotase